jgi:hypothetical protein
MSERARAATIRSSLRKELAARTRSTRFSAKAHRLNLVQPGNFKKPVIVKSLSKKSKHERNKQATKVIFDGRVTFQKLRLTFSLNAIH